MTFEGCKNFNCQKEGKGIDKSVHAILNGQLRLQEGVGDQEMSAIQGSVWIPAPSLTS